MTWVLFPAAAGKIFSFYDIDIGIIPRNCGLAIFKKSKKEHSLAWLLIIVDFIFCFILFIENITRNCGLAIFIKSMKEHLLAWLLIDMEQHRLEFMLKYLVGSLHICEVDGLMVLDEWVL